MAAHGLSAQDLGVAEAMAKSAADIRRFHASARRALAGYEFRGFERDELLTAMGGRGATERLLASNKHVRKRASELLIDEFGKLRRRSSKKPNPRFWHFSFLGPIVTEYQPQIDVDAFRNAIDRLIRPTRASALVGIELQPLTNYPLRGQGRGFLLNAHALVWTDDTSFDAMKAVETMKERGLLHSEFGAPTVTYSDRTLDKGQIEYLGYYLLKAPADGKRRFHDDILKRWSLKKVAAVRSDLQLRLMEILSHLEFTDLVHGIRGGTRVRSTWKRSLADWNKVRCARAKPPLETNFDIAELWERVRARQGNGSRHYSPTQWFGPRPRPVASESLPRASGKRLRPQDPRIIPVATVKPDVGAVKTPRKLCFSLSDL